MSGDCWCDNCAVCRREMREMKALAFTPAPVALSELALKILAEPVGYVPPPTPKPPRVPAAKKPREKKPREKKPREKKPKPVVVQAVPIPCVECGELRGLSICGKGHRRPSGRNDRCEVCADRGPLTATLADPATKTPRATRCRRALERVLKDGRAYHPDAQHGTRSGYELYSCRCAPCRESKTIHTARYGRPTVGLRHQEAA